MDANAVRKTLVAQHGRIGRYLARCQVLAHSLRNGEAVELELDAALAQLRAGFNEHNAAETGLIRSLLGESSHWGTQLVERMLEEHIAEHAAFCQTLAGSARDVAAGMDDLVEELDAHMAAEERTFLSPLVLADHVITRHRRPEPT
jgi:hypothetical protein